MDDLKIELLRCTLNKCSDYREEEEWRILSLSNKIPFTIKAVYIGRLCCETDKAKILQICNQSKIPVFQQRTSVINGVMHFDQLL